MLREEYKWHKDNFANFKGTHVVAHLKVADAEWIISSISKP